MDNPIRDTLIDILSSFGVTVFVGKEVADYLLNAGESGLTVQEAS